MANLKFNIKSACTFLWKIQNFKYLWLNRRQKIQSPVFVVAELENTEWYMCLSPTGHSPEDNIGFYLYRNEDSSCADSIDVYFELAFLSENGSTLCYRRSEKHTFNKCSSRGYDSFLNLENVNAQNKSMYFPLNTFTARCKIWRWDGKAAVDKYFLAGSRIVIQNRSFQWEIEKFSTIGEKEKRNLVIRSVTKEELMTFNLYWIDKISVYMIYIDIQVFHPSAKFLLFKTHILDAHGNCIDDFGPVDFLFEGREKKGCLLLTIKKKLMIEGKYLKNDVLTLYCNFLVGISSETIEKLDFDIESRNVVNSVAQNVNGFSTDGAVSLREDLGSLCSCDVLSDMKLRTNTNTIPVHSQILGARSPVFRAMFTNDMKETIEECINVPEMDNDTVRRMLQYMYTDELEDLQWEDASQLYAAADKYDIVSLRTKCCAILQAKLSPTNACQILILADKHQDEVLKKTVQDYILMQGKNIFSSVEWKLFMKTDLQLAAEIMYMNCNKN